ncbi:MAG: YggS family pyridoxal phosphate-dependent enzyme [Planctomycetota bacterium]|nr:YggS family pyridoxal phosphate-dependent enzyme [Planctomycetota bacterium]
MATSSEVIAARYAEVCDKVAKAAKRSGRKASDIILVAVTKYAVPEQIKALLGLGHRDFGENKAQTLLQHAAIVDEFFTRQTIHATTRKVRSQESAASLFHDSVEMELKPMANLPSGRDGVRWHMIGHLQRNKAKKVCDVARLVHSVDSLRLAEELQAIALKRDQPIDVLIQVNCSGEASKFGCLPPAAIPLAEQIATMINVRVRGLMTMAAPTANPEETRETFGRCRELFEEMRLLKFGEGVPFNILSMGMSGDYEVAISEGANIVRVGSAIFGEPAASQHEEPVEREDPED